MSNNPQEYHFFLPEAGRPEDVIIPETWYPGVRALWKKTTRNRKYHAVNGIKAIVIHATAGYSSAGAVSVMKAGRASWHWLVPDENEAEHGQLVWACAPESLAAWHVRNDKFHEAINGGKKLVNHWSLGIELVNRQIGKKDPFSDWQVEVTADIVRYCWAKYPNLEYVVSHAMLDPQRRSDPGSHFPWERFKSLVLHGRDTVPDPCQPTVSERIVNALELPELDEDICC